MCPRGTKKLTIAVWEADPRTWNILPKVFKKKNTLTFQICIDLLLHFHSVHVSSTPSVSGTGEEF